MLTPVVQKTLWVRRPWRRLPRGLWRTFRDEITRSRMRWRNLECFAWRLRLLCSAALACRADQVAAAGQRQQHREAKHASLPPPPARSMQCLLGLELRAATMHCALPEFVSCQKIRSSRCAPPLDIASIDCCFGETLQGTGRFLHLIAHWWLIHTATVAPPPPPLFRLCQVGQYLEPGAICVRRRRRRHIAAAAAWCGGGRHCRRTWKERRSNVWSNKWKPGSEPGRSHTCPLLIETLFFTATTYLLKDF